MSTAEDRGSEQRFLSGYPAAARYSGMSDSVLRRLVDEGKLHIFKPTGQRKILFDKTELDELILGSVVGQSA